MVHLVWDYFQQWINTHLVHRDPGQNNNKINNSVFTVMKEHVRSGVFWWIRLRLHGHLLDGSIHSWFWSFHLFCWSFRKSAALKTLKTFFFFSNRFLTMRNWVSQPINACKVSQFCFFFVFFLFSCFWFEVGRAQLEKGDVTYLRAPIRV